ncbi:MAG TPA: isoprenylcysteine carboxylmethyltransferase family protein [Candidatus Acidoferrales bacterium]|nr:isoprenylcysteine carboxylmethyltransferase family protein [Candidatus Acidoferrales bacterium]
MTTGGMSVLDLARLAAWLAAGVYGTIPLFWLFVHPFAGYWRRRRRSPFRVLAPLWVLLWILAWAATAHWRLTLVYDHAWAWLFTPLLWCVSLTMYIGGLRSLTLGRIIGTNEIVERNPGDSLITTGIHARVRHPLYFGHLCTLLGWTIGAGTAACFILLAFAIATGAIMIPMEERELRARFGSEYDAYARRVPALIPRP